MRASLDKARSNRESGFTLIELLVVIVIIGILAAIAIPVFTSQRGRANDAQAVSAVRSYTTALETLRVDTAGVIPSAGFTVAQAENEGARKSTGVTVTINKDGSTGYFVCASHSAGKAWKTGTAVRQYSSNTGQLTTESICTDTAVF